MLYCIGYERCSNKNTRPSFFLRERVFSCVRDISVNEYLFVIVYADGAQEFISANCNCHLSLRFIHCLIVSVDNKLKCKVLYTESRGVF